MADGCLAGVDGEGGTPRIVAMAGVVTCPSGGGKRGIKTDCCYGNHEPRVQSPSSVAIQGSDVNILIFMTRLGHSVTRTMLFGI